MAWHPFRWMLININGFDLCAQTFLSFFFQITSDYTGMCSGKPPSTPRQFAETHPIEMKQCKQISESLCCWDSFLSKKPDGLGIPLDIAIRISSPAQIQEEHDLSAQDHNLGFSWRLLHADHAGTSWRISMQLCWCFLRHVSTLGHLHWEHRWPVQQVLKPVTCGRCQRITKRCHCWIQKNGLIFHPKHYHRAIEPCL